jgi:hypothetical protein
VHLWFTEKYIKEFMSMKTPVFVVTVLLLVALVAFPVSALDISRCVVHDLPPEQVVRDLGVVPASPLSAEDSLALHSFRFTADTLKLLAILVEWTDRP